MVDNGCPCNGCTTETGRSPTCHHDGTCTRGHENWKRKHDADRAARNKAKSRQNDADGMLAENAIKTIKRRRRHGR